MIFYFKYRQLKKKMDEIIDNGLGDTLIKHILIENGQIDATFENKIFTRMLATWARQSLEQHKAPNFLTLTFGDGKQLFELTVRRNMPGCITPAEKLVMLENQIKELTKEQNNA